MVSGLLSVAGLIRRRVVVGGYGLPELLARDLPSQQAGKAHHGGGDPGLGAMRIILYTESRAVRSHRPYNV